MIYYAQPISPSLKPRSPKHHRVLQRVSKQVVITVAALLIVLVFCAGIFLQPLLNPTVRTLAEQTGGSPTAATDSRFKQAYDALVSANHGGTSIPEWSNDWGTMWNRIMRAALWTPSGDATASDVMAGKTFYSGTRGQLTGTYQPAEAMYGGIEQQNSSDDTAGDGTWTEASSGGTAASVTLRSTTVTLSSNSVRHDQRTGLYWSDRTSGTVSNNGFADTSGLLDRVTPNGNYCNFNSTGNANQYCNTYNAGVSANEFCLNLSLDANDDDVPETDWRLPTEKELLAAFVNGSANNLTTTAEFQWASTQSTATRALAVDLAKGYAASADKSFSGGYARCVRG